MSYLLFDIGGTNTRLAISRDKTTFEEPRIFETPKDFDQGMAKIREVSLELAGTDAIQAAAGGIAGTLSRDRMTFVNGPHLSGWNGKPITKALSDALGAPVYIENDTAIVGLGEATAGAGKGHRIVAYMTVSTGVGGVRIVDGKIDVAAIGFEPGHQIIDAGGALHQSSVGGYGLDLEGYVSGTAVSDRYGKKPYEITDEAFWDEMARLLAFGLNNTIVHWSPDAVVLGGSMMKKIGIPVPRVEAYLRGILHVYPELPVIVHSSLEDIGGLHGAVAFLNQKTA
ncbi:MAG TPA: ROK family protein [Candidatus Paceibacterota bacterium]|nr:ROK family protein [Candidatus Paceibacterota bacterium]